MRRLLTHVSAVPLFLFFCDLLSPNLHSRANMAVLGAGDSSRLDLFPFDYNSGAVLSWICYSNLNKNHYVDLSFVLSISADESGASVGYCHQPVI